MTYLIITVSFLAFSEVIILTLFGKRACKKEKPVKPNYSGWEASAIAYNRAHGLPDDTI